jgi:hypothetical protein
VQPSAVGDNGDDTNLAGGTFVVGQRQPALQPSRKPHSLRAFRRDNRDDLAPFDGHTLSGFGYATIWATHAAGSVAAGRGSDLILLVSS